MLLMRDVVPAAQQVQVLRSWGEGWLGVPLSLPIDGIPSPHYLDPLVDPEDPSLPHAVYKSPHIDRSDCSTFMADYGSK